MSGPHSKAERMGRRIRGLAAFTGALAAILAAPRIQAPVRSERWVMILSNEPGYYRAGVYGIRTENLVPVVEAPALPAAEKALNAFETLTLAPIDRRLMEVSLLDADERAWLDAYHARVAAMIGPLVDDSTRIWLGAATRPLAQLEQFEVNFRILWQPRGESNQWVERPKLPVSTCSDDQGP